jgi:DNA adenine methylase
MMLLGMPSVLADKPSLIRPFIKWAGGKTRLLPALLPYVPEGFRRYHEPFLGGGAMLLAAHDRGGLDAWVSDLNEELVNAWQTAIGEPAALHARLLSFAELDSEDYYYEVRGQRYTDPVDRAAHFVYLNRTSWNGLYRVNRWGEFNVPWGAREFSMPTIESLRSFAAGLAAVRIRCSDFREALDDVREGDFVYLDPPYLRVSDTSKFNGYTQKRFGQKDLEELAASLRELTGRGAQWLLSNRDSEHIRELFLEEEIVRLTVRRSVAAQNRRDIEPAKSPEVIVSNRLCLP